MSDDNRADTTNISLAIGRYLPFELAWDIWNRYYTYIVLEELLKSPRAIKANMFDCEIEVQYIYLFPHERALFPRFDEELEFKPKNNKARRRYHRLELK